VLCDAPTPQGIPASLFLTGAAISDVAAVNRITLNPRSDDV
jgi:hypothetical protein